MTPVAALNIDSVSTLGSGLTRPESVRCWNGRLYSCDAVGTVAVTTLDGATRFLCQPEALPEGVRPNGISIRRDGSIVFANVGHAGGVWRIDGEGQVRPLIEEIDGVRLPSTNFAYADRDDRLWICVSSTAADCHDPEFRFDRHRPSGFVAMVDQKGQGRIVADGISWTNECRIDATGRAFYVNETIGRRLLRFDLAGDGTLSNRTAVTAFGDGSWPDGMEIDPSGAIWITSPISNRVIKVLASGEQVPVLEDADEKSIEITEAAYRANDFRRSHFYQVASKNLRHVTSITFSLEHELAFLGSLRNDALYRFSTAGLM
ncbi:SMP-30/gluconolactonase/LRE family protein [Caballeronia sp. LZ033]|uniref:SMP-30/gluconolactonase/LRE family protein n=1 Tax=Caballeronia sp. LZ033 TaxID=3038566 RepID=UPI002860E9A2|nr:SMP-30/gluconolactonase/LRE family protein [Caballeronia sp. LZ033]MDR5815696.1 SMP-30/gluconolactonase/LRE family protein [Caballeronia sp. LZ033]